MCDRVACAVRIVTRTDGDRQVFTGTGQLTRSDDSFSVCYRGKEYEGTLELSGGVLTMVRQGEAAMSATFAAGRETELVLRLGGSEGRLAVCTDRLEPTFGENSVVCLLSYRLGGDEAVRYHLEISLFFSEGS